MRVKRDHDNMYEQDWKDEMKNHKLWVQKWTRTTEIWEKSLVRKIWQHTLQTWKA